MKKIFRMALVCALAGAALMNTSCTKDYSGDIQDLQTRLSTLEQTVEGLKTQIAAGALITDVQKNDQGFLIKLNNGQTYQVMNGAKGDKGDTGATGAKGDKGDTGAKGDKGDTGATGAQGEKGEKGDKGDATVVKIGENGNWTIDGVDTGVPARGVDGKDGQNGKDGVDGKDGKDGKDGVDGKSPYVGEDGCWMVWNAEKAEWTNTGIKAEGTPTAVWDAEHGVLKLMNLTDAEGNPVEDIVLDLNVDLTSIVFVPQVYFEGIEAALYKYAYGNAVTFTTDEGMYVDQLNNECYVSNDQSVLTAKAVIVPALKDNDEVMYSLSRVNELQYKVNPAAYVLDPVEKWSLEGMLKQYITRAPQEGWDAWKPVLLNIEKDAEDANVANVTYKIENAEVLEEICAPGADELYVPIIALMCETKNETVHSDYEAVVPSQEYFTAITFNCQTIDEEHRPDCTVEPTLKPHLYQSAGEAIKNLPSLEVQYFGKAINLKSMMTTHVYSEATNTEYAMTLADIEKYYPELHVRFYNTTYIAGINNSEQNQYCILNEETGMFQPAYPKFENGKWVVYPCVEGDPNVGMSAQGRQPIVLVTLEREVTVKGKKQVETIVAGYFKIILTDKEPKDPTTTGFEFTPFPTVPYICEYDALATTWKEFSWGVLEAELHMTYDEFLAEFTCQPGTFTFKKGGDKKNDKDYTKVEPETKYGTLTYVQDDRKISSVNDIFTWQLSYEQATAISELPGRTVTLYKQFMSKSGDLVFVGLTVTVAERAKVDFGANKIANEWFDDVNNEYKNTAHVNVLVPTADETSPVIGGDVTKFYRDLNHYFVGYTPAVGLAKESEAIYKNYIKAEDLTFEYVFSTTQPKVGGVQFLSVEAADGVGTAIVNKANKKDTIATLTPEGIITYKWEEGNTTAKKLLNLWGHSAEETAKGILYANVDVRTYYGRCEIPADVVNFHVRFIRPIDVEFVAKDMSKDGIVDGENVKVVDFLEGITDWNEVPVLVKNEDGELQPYVTKTIDMYAYYQFKNLTINLEKAEINNWDMADATKRGLLMTVKPDAQLALGTIDEDEVFTLVSKTNISLDITNFDELKKYVINYRNDRARVTEFDIFIPVEIEYSWGVYTAELEINVAKTN